MLYRCNHINGLTAVTNACGGTPDISDTINNILS